MDVLQFVGRPIETYKYNNGNNIEIIISPTAMQLHWTVGELVESAHESISISNKVDDKMANLDEHVRDDWKWAFWGGTAVRSNRLSMGWSSIKYLAAGMAVYAV